VTEIKIGALCWNQYTDWPAFSKPASAPTDLDTRVCGRATIGSLLPAPTGRALAAIRRRS